ncbi:MAG: hypothetical protein KGL35_30970, partial [Bradyrhizobium sp.]|nr:hypothetical protein [Bradyrhizobium sp.]
KVNIAEQLACSIVVAAHAPPPNLVGANESRSPLGGERLFQQPASGAVLMSDIAMGILLRLAKPASQSQHVPLPNKPVALFRVPFAGADTQNFSIFGPHSALSREDHRARKVNGEGKTTDMHVEV